MRLSHYSELGKQGTAQEALQDCAVLGVEMEKSDDDRNGALDGPDVCPRDHSSFAHFIFRRRLYGAVGVAPYVERYVDETVSVNSLKYNPGT